MVPLKELQLAPALQEKLQALENYIRDLGSIVVAYSGGVDSTLVAAVAQQVLGDKACAFTVDSPTSAEGESQEAIDFAKDIGIKHTVQYIDELENDEFTANTEDRCYVCKKSRFSGLVDWAKEQGIQWILDGSNVDDLGDYRPGMRALSELESIKSPLMDTGFSKPEIRTVAKAMGLKAWDKPSAPCLATRVPYGHTITPEALARISKGEHFLRQYTKNNFRVRDHETVARIEVVAEDFALFANPDQRKTINDYFESLGFHYVCVDLKPFKSGNLNREVTQDKD